MQSFNLNLAPGSFKQVFNASQYDVGRELKITIYDGSALYAIPTGATVKVEGTKPSGLGFSVSCTFDGSEVTVTTTDTMTNEWGRVPVELSISKSGLLLGTANFILDIERSPHPEGTTDGDAQAIVPYLTELVERIEESNAKIEGLTVEAEALSPGATPTAAYDPDTNKLTLGIPVQEIEFTDTNLDGHITISIL